MARRQGLELVRSRRRDPRALDYGGYLLRDPSTNLAAYSVGWNGFGARLDDVESWLLSGARGPADRQVKQQSGAAPAKVRRRTLRAPPARYQPR